MVVQASRYLTSRKFSTYVIFISQKSSYVNAPPGGTGAKIRFVCSFFFQKFKTYFFRYH